MNATQSTVKAFYTWTRGGTDFIAFPCGAGVFVVDELGRGYGSWESVDRFRKLQADGSNLTAPLVGVGYRLAGSVYQSA